MPHLQLEVSANIADRNRLDKILAELTEVFSEQETVDPKAVKAYARIAEHWAMGEGAPSQFIHLTVCILAGRTPDHLSQISDRLYHQMKVCFQESTAFGTASLTLEIREMNPAYYRKLDG